MSLYQNSKRSCSAIVQSSSKLHIQRHGFLSPPYPLSLTKVTSLDTSELIAVAKQPMLFAILSIFPITGKIIPVRRVGKIETK